MTEFLPPQPNSQRQNSTGSSLGGTAFVGRRREMATLEASLAAAMSGRGQIAMLAGEPGIGKTRIAQELASHASSLGAQTFWGWCYEQEGAPPYWPWGWWTQSRIEP